jgi:hypothetical protein
MTEPQGPRKAPGESIQTEKITLDLSQLAPEQVDDLRRRLRDLASGHGGITALQEGAQLQPSHSSHKDSDGWI